LTKIAVVPKLDRFMTIHHQTIFFAQELLVELSWINAEICNLCYDRYLTGPVPRYHLINGKKKIQSLRSIARRKDGFRGVE